MAPLLKPPLAAAAVGKATGLKYHAFYRGEHANFLPADPDFDREDAFSEFITKGLATPAPFITKHTTVLGFGSCLPPYPALTAPARIQRSVTQHLAQLRHSHERTLRKQLLDSSAIRLGLRQQGSFGIALARQVIGGGCLRRRNSSPDG